MEHWPGWLQSLMSVHITSGPLYTGIWLTTIIGLAALLIWQVLRTDRRRAWWQLLGAAAPGGAGLLVAWLLSDVFMVFGVSLGWAVIRGIAVGFAMIGFLGVTVAHARAWRRAVAIALIPVALVATAMHVDSIYGEYQTIGSLFNYSPYPSIRKSRKTTAKTTVKQWRRLAETGRLPELPAAGKLFTTSIDNTNSGFAARDAIVYLPPAALSDDPPALPVMVMLAGQPGSPNRFFTASGIVPMLDAYAAAHDGLAPIVVSPDQNGAATINSLCADTTKHGNAETYLTQDVNDWIRAHLPVATAPSAWTIGGFSQGGTCSTQLGPRHLDQYGNVLAVDGEIEPTAGSVDEMVRDYFGGDRSAYEAQVPVNAIADHAPSDQTMILAAGGNDEKSVGNVRTIGKAARKAGMTVVTLTVPGTGHDWHAVNAVLEASLPWLCARMGLGSTDKTWKDYPKVSELL